MTYTMSKDYDKLYDLLCAGGEALGRYEGYEGMRPAMLLKPPVYDNLTDGIGPMMWYGDIEVQSPNSTNPNREAFNAECTRLNLEWLAPVDLAGVLEAGEELRAAAMERVPKVSIDKPADMRLYHAFHNWTTATAKFRKP